MTRSQVKMLKASRRKSAFTSPTKINSTSKASLLKSPKSSKIFGKSNSKLFLDGVISKVLKKTSSSTLLFGRPLEDVCGPQEQPPKAIMVLLDELMRTGPNSCGIFRKSGNVRLVKEWKEHLDKSTSEKIDFEELNIYAVASLLKEYFRSLPDCLLCSELYEKWLEIPKTIDEREKLSLANHLLEKLKKPNFNLLKSLMSVLKRIAENSENNKMTFINLSVCIGPSILWPTRSESLEYHPEITTTIAYLIEMCSELFSEGNLPTSQISSMYVPFHGDNSSIPKAAESSCESLCSDSQSLNRNSESVSHNSEPFTGNSEPFTGNSEPFTGNSEPFTGNSEPFTGNSEPFTGNSEQLPQNFEILSELRSSLKRKSENLSHFPIFNKCSNDSQDSGLNDDVDSEDDYIGLEDMEFDFTDGIIGNKENTEPTLKKKRQFNYSKKNYHSKYHGYSPRIRRDDYVRRRSLFRKIPPKNGKSLVRAASEESILQKLTNDDSTMDFLDRQLLTEQEESNLIYTKKYSNTNSSKDSGLTIDDFSTTASEEDLVEVIELTGAMESLDCHPKRPEMLRRSSMKKIETFEENDNRLKGIICNNAVEFTDEQLCPISTDEEPCKSDDSSSVSRLSSQSSFKRNSWMRKRSKTKIKLSKPTS